MSEDKTHGYFVQFLNGETGLASATVLADLMNLARIEADRTGYERGVREGGARKEQNLFVCIQEQCNETYVVQQSRPETVEDFLKGKG